MKLHLLLTVASLTAAGTLSAADPIVASKYLTGTVCRDVSAAITKGKAEHRPVWIAAWDEKFQMSPEGRKGNAAAYSLGNFYGSPETKKLLSSNFIQVFTTMANPAIQDWLDTADISHEPVYIVLDSDGNLVTRKHSSANAANGLQDVQGIIAKLNK